MEENERAMHISRFGGWLLVACEMADPVEEHAFIRYWS